MTKRGDIAELPRLGEADPGGRGALDAQNCLAASGAVFDEFSCSRRGARRRRRHRGGEHYC